MNSTLNILSTVVCKRCNTALVYKFEENGVIKYKCFCLQKVRVILICGNCKKQFLNLPYLIRKSNFCSSICYRVGTNKKQLKSCRTCKKEFYANASLLRKGYGFYCSRDCWFSLFKLWKKTIVCIQCKVQFQVLRSVYKTHPKYCSKRCADDFRRDYVTRVCRKCNIVYELPRSDLNRGRGSFCTWKCFKRFRGETSIEKIVRLELERLKEPFKQEMKFGRFHADFFLPLRKLVIECDGEYWHRGSFTKDRDYRKDQFLQKQGYRILRLAENTIRKGKLSVLKNLLQ